MLRCSGELSCSVCGSKRSCLLEPDHAAPCQAPLRLAWVDGGVPWMLFDAASPSAQGYCGNCVMDMIGDRAAAAMR